MARAHRMGLHIYSWDAHRIGDSSCKDQFSSSTPVANSDSARTTRCKYSAAALRSAFVRARDSVSSALARNRRVWRRIPAFIARYSPRRSLSGSICSSFSMDFFSCRCRARVLAVSRIDGLIGTLERGHDLLATLDAYLFRIIETPRDRGTAAVS